MKNHPITKLLRPLLIATVTMGFAGRLAAETNLWTFATGFANGGVIPDGNTTGWSDTRTVTGVTALQIADVNVSLNLAGGYNGDFYAYLTHAGGFSVLLNRPGRASGNALGYGDAGLNVTFDDSAVNGDIHNYQTVSGYAPLIGNGDSWSPDGRNVNPVFALDTDDRTRLLDQFTGLNPNGNWTLFIADVSSGEQATVLNWALNITTTVEAVPEPAGLSLGLLGLLAWRFMRSKARN